MSTKLNIENSQTQEKITVTIPDTLKLLYQQVAAQVQLPPESIHLNVKSIQDAEEKAQNDVTVTLKTMRDMYRAFWRNPNNNLPSLWKLFFNQIENIKPNKDKWMDDDKKTVDETTDWLMYFFMSPIQDPNSMTILEHEDKIKSWLETVGNEKVGSFIVDPDGKLLLQKWEEYTGKNNDTWMKEMATKLKTVLQDLTKQYGVSAIQTHQMINIIDTDQIESATIKFEIPMINSMYYTLDSVFAQMLTTPEIPILTYRDLFKVDDRDLSVADSRFEWTNHYKFIENMVFEHMSLGKWKETPNKAELFIMMKMKNDHFAVLLLHPHLTIFCDKNDIESIYECLKPLLPNDRNYFMERAENGRELNIQASIDVPDFTFDPFILSTVILTNTDFSPYVSTTSEKDVKEIAQSSKFSLSTMFWIRGDTTETKTKSSKRTNSGHCTLTMMPNGDQVMTRLTFTFVKKKGDLTKAKEIFRKLLFYYQQQSQSMIDDFHQVTGYKASTISIESFQIEDIFSNLFKQGYTAECTNRPELVSQKTIKEKNYNENQWGEFPRNSGTFLRCPQPDHPYFGVKTKKNNEDEFLPCCYKEPQRDKQLYKNYRENKTTIKADKQAVIVTHTKAMDPDAVGTLPSQLTHFLFAIDPKHRPHFYRLGMSRTKWSLLDGILYGLNNEYRNMSNTEKWTQMQSILKRIGNDIDVIAFGAQQFARQNTEQIQDWILSISKEEFPGKTYLDPRKWMLLFEQFFNCAVYVFQHTNDVNASIVYPSFEMYPLIPFKLRPHCVFIYEHENVENFPRCELIGVGIQTNADSAGVEVKKSKYTSVQQQFDLKEVGDKYRPKFLTSFQNYTYNMKQNELQLTPYVISKSQLPFQQQVLDHAGKCRAILVNDLILLCDPLPSMPVPIIPFDLRLFESRTNDWKSLDGSFQIVAKSIKDHTIIEIHFSHAQFPNVLFTLKTNVELDDFPDTNIIPSKYPTIDDSNTQWTHFEKLSRLAQIIQPYFLFYTTQFLLMKQNDQFLQTFMKKFMVVNNDTMDYDDSEEAVNLYVDNQATRVKVINFVVYFVLSLINENWLYANVPLKDIIETTRELIQTWVIINPAEAQIENDKLISDFMDKPFRVEDSKTRNHLYTLLQKLVKYWQIYTFVRVKWPTPHQTKTETLKQIREIISKNVAIDENVQYQIPHDSKLTLEQLRDTGFINDEFEFVVDSQETQSKLTYLLVHRVSLGESLTGYVNHYQVPNFYRYLQDWSNSPDTLVLTSLDRPLLIDHRVYYEIDRDKSFGFMARNGVLDSLPFYMGEEQEESEPNEEKDRRQAIKYSLIWNESHLPFDHIVPGKKLSLWNQLRDQEVHRRVITFEDRLPHLSVKIEGPEIEPLETFAFIWHEVRREEKRKKNKDVHRWFSMKPLFQ